MLDHAIRFGNTEILDLPLQSINTEQKKLESESTLYEYKLREKLEDNEIYDLYRKTDLFSMIVEITIFNPCKNKGE